MTPYEILKMARSAERLTSVDYISGIFASFFELHGDRRFKDDPAVVSGVAYLDERPVTVIGIEKGHDTREHAFRSFGSPAPEGYRKALRLMKQAEKFNRPVICFVDTPGAFCGLESEERGQGNAIAESIYEMMGLRVPVITVMIGEGGSGGALALASSNRVYMLSSACYSVISPEGCASILFKDASKAEKAARSLGITADTALSLGVADEIIEDDGLPSLALFEKLKEKLEEGLSELEKIEDLAKDRYLRFRKLGLTIEE